jgi:hypothetical protein
MRIGESIWSRADFKQLNTTSSLRHSTTSTSTVKLNCDIDSSLQSNTVDSNRDGKEIVHASHHIIDSSKRIVFNRLFPNPTCKQHRYTLSNETSRIVHRFQTTDILVDENGPFWPLTFPMKHTKASFLHLISNNENRAYCEYYSLLGKTNRQTFDNQPAVYKYTENFKHPTLIYDMDKSPRKQQANLNVHENICPSLIFESRFEGGNLRQVRRM